MADFTAQRVRAKTRAAVRRREDQIESEEMESGELNLIPYLDMVTNLMLFILASVAGGLILSQINTTLPDKAPPGQLANKPDQSPDDQPLGLYVTIQKNSMILWSVSKLEGTLKNPKPGYVFQRVVNTNGQRCDGPYMCESNACEAPDKDSPKVCVASTQTPQPVYEYGKLNQALLGIARTRYAGKLRKPKTYAIVLQADQSTPYSVIVSVMTAMRCVLPKVGDPPQVCRMPNENADFKSTNEALSKDGKYYNTDLAPYDPNTMALFPQIQFSSGFE